VFLGAGNFVAYKIAASLVRKPEVSWTAAEHESAAGFTELKQLEKQNAVAPLEPPAAIRLDALRDRHARGELHSYVTALPAGDGIIHNTVLALPQSHERPDDRARALEAAGGIAYWQGDMEACQVYYDESLELFRRGGDQQKIANALYNASFPANVARLDLPKAELVLNEALPIFRSLNDKAGIARCLWAVGQTYIYTDQIERAIASLDEAIVLFRELGDRFGLGWALFVRALLWLRVDRVASARADLAEALEIFSEADDLSAEVLVIDSIAEVVRREGDAIGGARLAGAAKAHEAATGAGLNSIVGLREGWRSRALTLNEDEAAAHAAGEKMTLDEAVALARKSTSELPDPA